jgi:hypothetical protein
MCTVLLPPGGYTFAVNRYIKDDVTQKFTPPPPPKKKKYSDSYNFAYCK